MKTRLIKKTVERIDATCDLLWRRKTI